MKTPGSGGADVHPRPLAHRLQAFQHLDLLGAVGGLDFDDVAHAGKGSPGEWHKTAESLGKGLEAGRWPLRRVKSITAGPKGQPGASPVDFRQGMHSAPEGGPGQSGDPLPTPAAPWCPLRRW